MAILSSLRSRRFAARQSEDRTAKIEHLIVFRLREEWFAIDVLKVHKVIPLPKIYGDPHHTGISLTDYQGQEILVIDVGHKIFGESRQDLAEKGFMEQQYLVILQSESSELLGLPIDSAPTVRRVPESAFVAIPDTYLSTGNIRCISNKMIKADDCPAIFWLDTSQLKTQ